jgi:2,4-dienoyl-CoA reductase-like NADH-dependent reductase (Old Yellow Enzyme family)
MSKNAPTLFDPAVAGDLKLKNRIVLAPLTRTRAVGGERIPNALMAEYYSQRASAGLILTEATSIMPMGVGYPDTPGIWSKEQVAGWRQITNAVHAKGGQIVLQLWHVGRISDPSFLGGLAPVAPSAIAAEGHVSLLRPKRAFPVPRALKIEEIKQIIEAYAVGAKNAELAGFDGVEIHGANGYLPDQFLQDSTNKRTDEYGGNIINRARFLLEATDAAISVYGAGRVGVHISPRGQSNSMGDSDPKALFSYVASSLSERGVAFIFAREHEGPGSLGLHLKKIFGGHYIANEGFTRESAEAILKRGEADSVAFGRLFIANPDLPARFLKQTSLNELNAATLYGSTGEGYTDYPSLRP